MTKTWNPSSECLVLLQISNHSSGLRALPLHICIISAAISTTTCELKVNVNQEEGEGAGPHLEEFQDQVSDVKMFGHAILKWSCWSFTKTIKIKEIAGKHGGCAKTDANTSCGCEQQTAGLEVVLFNNARYKVRSRWVPEYTHIT